MGCEPPTSCEMHIHFFEGTLVFCDVWRTNSQKPVKIWANIYEKLEFKILDTYILYIKNKSIQVYTVAQGKHIRTCQGLKELHWPEMATIPEMQKEPWPAVGVCNVRRGTGMNWMTYNGNLDGVCPTQLGVHYIISMYIHRYVYIYICIFIDI